MQAASGADVGELAVDVGPTVPEPVSDLVNVAANPQKSAAGTQPFASYTSPYDDVWHIVDGRNSAHNDPSTRWTSYQSPNGADDVGVSFGRPVTVSDVRVWLYDDGGGVRVPSRHDLQYWTGGDWADVPGQTRTPAAPAADALNEITLR